jgi:hypothetical protein
LHDKGLVYKRNYISYQEKSGKVSVIMETKGRRREPSIDLPTITTIHHPQSCDFEGTDALSLMAETARLRKLITKRGTVEILIPAVPQILCGI